MKNLLWLIIIVIIAFAAAFLLPKYQQVSLPQPQFSLYYQQARVIKSFQLSDHHGKAFTNKNLQGKWSFVFIGYTSCPDVCPTTLQNLNFVYDDLKKIAANSQILFLSVDPKRDSVAKLNKYIGYFNKEFIALRGEHDQLIPFTRNLGLMYSLVDDENASSVNKENHDETKYEKKYEQNYLVNHSASIALINPQGKVAAIFKPEIAVGKVPSIEGEKLLSDFAKIVALGAH